MQKRIFYGKNTPIGFQETQSFDQECPYFIRYKEFQNEDLSPLHYGDSVEILVCRGLTGRVESGKTGIRIDRDMVILIPPQTVHSVLLQKGTGHLYLLQISLEMLRHTVDLEALFRMGGRQIGLTVLREPADFREAEDAVEEMIRRDEDPLGRTAALLRLLAVIQRQAPSLDALTLDEAEQGDGIKQVIRWTARHFRENISLEDAARAAGFSKNYFCSWFKKLTGTTYNQYLCDVRLLHACTVLQQTGSVSEACYRSGFRDPSYFVQSFRKKRGCTPKAYLENSR